MEYVIFPMQFIHVSQRHYSKKGTSHHQVKAIDIAGDKASSTGTNEVAYAPSRCKIIAQSGNSNTVHFGTCDAHGLPEQVMCEDGVARVLTYALTHIDDQDMYKLHYENGKLDIGKIFEAGDVFYKEGTKNTSARHIHLEIAEGWIKEKIEFYNGYGATGRIRKFADEVSLFPHQIFFQLQNWNIEKNLNGYTYQKVSNRECVITQPSLEKRIYLKASQLSFRIRDTVVDGKSLAIVKMKENARILSFLDKQTDGYQWVKVSYKGIIGYSQLDLFNAYIIMIE